MKNYPNETVRTYVDKCIDPYWGVFGTFLSSSNNYVNDLLDALKDGKSSLEDMLDEFIEATKVKGKDDTYVHISYTDESKTEFKEDYHSPDEVLTHIKGAPLNSPNFTGVPTYTQSQYLYYGPDNTITTFGNLSALNTYITTNTDQKLSSLSTEINNKITTLNNDLRVYINSTCDQAYQNSVSFTNQQISNLHTTISYETDDKIKTAIDNIVFPDPIQPSNAVPRMDGMGWSGKETPYARQDHVHPVDTSRAALAGSITQNFSAATVSCSNINSTKGSISTFTCSTAVASSKVAAPSVTTPLITTTSQTFAIKNTYNNSSVNLINLFNGDGFGFLDINSDVVVINGKWVGVNGYDFTFSNKNSTSMGGGLVLANGTIGASDDSAGRQWRFGLLPNSETAAISRLAAGSTSSNVREYTAIEFATDQRITVYSETTFTKNIHGAFADISELYQTDTNYLPGYILMQDYNIDNILSLCTDPYNPLGVVSTNPFIIMNDTRDVHDKTHGIFNKNAAIALVGKVPVMITGPVHRGKSIVSNGNGIGIEKPNGDNRPHVGKSTVTDLRDETRLVECYVRHVI